jgi:hypothetical protein
MEAEALSRRSTNGGWRGVALIILLSALALLAVLLSARRALKVDPSPDGAVVYYNARVALRGQNPYDGQNETDDWKAGGGPAKFLPGHDNLPFCAYPPSFMLLIAPVAALPWQTGIRAVVWLNYLAGFGCLFFLLKLANRRWSPAAILLLVVFFFANRHIRSEIYVNQTTLLICLPMLAGIYAFTRKRDLLAGALIGLSLAKFTLTLPVLALLVYRREWRAASAALITFVVLNAGMAMTWGGLRQLPADYRSAVSKSTLPGAANDVSTLKYTDMISANHLVFALFGEERRSPAGKAALVLVAACGLLALCALRPRPGQERAFENPLDISIAMLASLSLFYHRSYDLAALPIVLWGLMDYRFRRKGPMPAAWKIAVGAVVVLGFCVSRDGSLSPFDSNGVGRAHGLISLVLTILDGVARHTIGAHNFNSVPMLVLLLSVIWLQLTTRPKRDVPEVEPPAVPAGAAQAT